MANYDIKALQNRLLGILLAFDKVCSEHGLRYCICGGTMIGAVRHKGFIPWDDDSYALKTIPTIRFLSERYRMLRPP